MSVANCTAKFVNTLLNRVFLIGDEKMKLYSDNGYANMRELMNLDIPFIFAIGGRGIGKTYSVLKEQLAEGTEFIYMRRTQTQADMINKPEFSPFKAIMHDNPDINIGSISISKYNAAFYNMIEVDDKLTPAGAPIGYTCALSTIANMRGFDASNVKRIIYDEFISEKHERPLKAEGAALLNCYETINRNRELKGEKPVQLICLANANNLACPVFAELNLIDIVDKMVRKKQQQYINYDRGIAVIMFRDSPISEGKKHTALYRATSGSKFTEMSLNNDFSSEDYSMIGSRPLQEYNPVVVFEDVCVYEHKSNDTYYVCRHISGSPPVYNDTEMNRKKFKTVYYYVYLSMVAGKVVFADYYSKLKLTSLY